MNAPESRKGEGGKEEESECGRERGGRSCKPRVWAVKETSFSLRGIDQGILHNFFSQPTNTAKSSETLEILLIWENVI